MDTVAQTPPGTKPHSSPPPTASTLFTPCPIHANIGFCATLDCAATYSPGSVTSGLVTPPDTPETSKEPQQLREVQTGKAKMAGLGDNINDVGKKTNIVRQGPSSFIFPKLSYELRAQIFQEILKFDGALELEMDENGRVKLMSMIKRERGPYDSILRHDITREEKEAVFAITRVCWQARKEAWHLFLHENDFRLAVIYTLRRFDDSHDITHRLRAGALQKWFATLKPSKVLSLRTFKIDIGSWRLERQDFFFPRYRVYYITPGNERLTSANKRPHLGLVVAAKRLLAGTGIQCEVLMAIETPCKVHHLSISTTGTAVSRTSEAPTTVHETFVDISIYLRTCYGVSADMDRIVERALFDVKRSSEDLLNYYNEEARSSCWEYPDAIELLNGAIRAAKAMQDLQLMAIRTMSRGTALSPIEEVASIDEEDAVQQGNDGAAPSTDATIASAQTVSIQHIPRGQVKIIGPRWVSNHAMLQSPGSYRSGTATVSPASQAAVAPPKPKKSQGLGKKSKEHRHWMTAKGLY